MQNALQSIRKFQFCARKKRPTATMNPANMVVQPKKIDYAAVAHTINTLDSKVQKVSVSSLVVMKVLNHIQQEFASMESSGLGGGVTTAIPKGPLHPRYLSHFQKNPGYDADSSMPDLSGFFLGLLVGETLQITDCCPKITDAALMKSGLIGAGQQADVENLCNKAFVDYMINNEKQNLDSHVAGFYQTSDLTTTIDDIFKYQDDNPDSVYFHIDVGATLSSNRLQMYAFRLPTEVLELYREESFSASKLRQKGIISARSLFEPIPIVFESDPLSALFVYEQYKNHLKSKPDMLKIAPGPSTMDSLQGVKSALHDLNEATSQLQDSIKQGLHKASKVKNEAGSLYNAVSAVEAEQIQLRDVLNAISHASYATNRLTSDTTVGVSTTAAMAGVSVQ